MNTLEAPFGLDEGNRKKILLEIKQQLTEAEIKAFSEKIKRIVTEHLLDDYLPFI
jgi:hypothetical protein